MSLPTENLARSAGRHPWRTLVVWVVAFLTAGVLSSLFLISFRPADPSAKT